MSDPANPVFLNYLDTINSYINEIGEAGHYLLMVDFKPFLNVYDNSDPTNITLVASVPTRSSTYGLRIIGNYAYVPEAEAGVVQVFHIRNPSNVVEAARFDTRGRCERPFRGEEPRLCRQLGPGPGHYSVGATFSIYRRNRCDAGRAIHNRVSYRPWLAPAMESFGDHQLESHAVLVYGPRRCSGLQILSRPAAMMI